MTLKKGRFWLWRDWEKREIGKVRNRIVIYVVRRGPGVSIFQYTQLNKYKRWPQSAFSAFWYYFRKVEQNSLLIFSIYLIHTRFTVRKKRVRNKMFTKKCLKKLVSEKKSFAKSVRIKVLKKVFEKNVLERKVLNKMDSKQKCSKSKTVK